MAKKWNSAQVIQRWNELVHHYYLDDSDDYFKIRRKDLLRHSGWSFNELYEFLTATRYGIPWVPPPQPFEPRPGSLYFDEGF